MSGDPDATPPDGSFAGRARFFSQHLTALARSREQLAAAPDAGGTSAAGLRAAAWLSALRGDVTEALRQLDQAVLRPDDRGEAGFAKGLLLLGLDENDAAVEALRHAAQQIFPEPEAVRKASDIAAMLRDGNRYGVFGAFYDNFRHDFCFAVACRRITRAEAQGYAFCMDRLSAFVGRGHPALPAILVLDEELNGPSYWSQVNLGHSLWLRNDRAGAD